MDLLRLSGHGNAKIRGNRRVEIRVRYLDRGTRRVRCRQRADHA